MQEAVMNHADWFILDVYQESLKMALDNIFKKSKHQTVIVLLAKNGHVCVVGIDQKHHIH